MYINAWISFRDPLCTQDHYFHFTEEKTGSERARLPKVTELVDVGAGGQIQGLLPPNSISLLYIATRLNPESPASLTVISGLAGICSVHWVLSSHSTFAQVFPSAGGAPFPSQPHSPSYPLGLSFSITAPGSPRHCSGSPKPL